MVGLFSLKDGDFALAWPDILPVAGRVASFIVLIMALLWLPPLNAAAAGGHAFPALSGSSTSFATGFESADAGLESVEQGGIAKAGDVAGTVEKVPATPKGLISRFFVFAGNEVESFAKSLANSWTNAGTNNWANDRATRLPGLIKAPAQLIEDDQAAGTPSIAREFDPKDAALWEPLISRLTADGLDEARVRKAFDDLGLRYTSLPMGRKLLELYGLRYGGALQAGSVDGEEEVIVESDFSPVPTSLSLAGCRKLIKNNDKLFKGVQKRYGVPAHTIVALLLVETNLGNDLGNDPAFRNLASMALSSTPEHISQHLKKLKLNKEKRDFIQTSLDNKSEWAYGELKALINYADDMGFELMKIPGSMYGAVGICQFMPSNVKPYGIDGDGDGKVNLFKLSDAVHSVANYLQQHGWKPGMDPVQQLAVLRAYNQDNIYAYTVQAVSGRLVLGDEFYKSPAIMAANPLSLVRGTVVPGYRRQGKVIAPLKPIPGYNDILGINPSPAKIKNGVIPGLTIEK